MLSGWAFAVHQLIPSIARLMIRASPNMRRSYARKPRSRKCFIYPSQYSARLLAQKPSICKQYTRSTSLGALRYQTTLTASPNHILNDMCMRDFRPYTPTGVRRVGLSVGSCAELAEQALDTFFVRRSRVRAQEAGEVVDVAAGEADESFLFCFLGQCLYRRVMG